jgi:hypothetical protein
MYVVLSGSLAVIKALGFQLSAPIPIQNPSSMHKREASSPITKKHSSPIKHTECKQVSVVDNLHPMFEEIEEMDKILQTFKNTK